MQSMLTETLPKLSHGVPGIHPDSLQHAGRLEGRIESWIRETLCALHGHEMMLHFHRGQRVCLRCVECGRETPGWHTR
jgi:hypothetical protein